MGHDPFGGAGAAGGERDIGGTAGIDFGQGPGLFRELLQGLGGCFRYPDKLRRATACREGDLCIATEQDEGRLQAIDQLRDAGCRVGHIDHAEGQAGA
ncbi:hypothetical protein D3C76_1398880 [compost metagenome]